jgi:hypothetical protein
MLLLPLAGAAAAGWQWRRGLNGHKTAAPCGRGGHNNTENNPVFRGMIRRKADSQPKESK